MAYPTDGSFFVAPFAFDAPGVGVCMTDRGVPLYGVFSYDDGPEDGPYCQFTGTRFECKTMMDDWNARVARGELVVCSPVLRYF